VLVGIRRLALVQFKTPTLKLGKCLCFDLNMKTQRVFGNAGNHCQEHKVFQHGPLMGIVVPVPLSKVEALAIVDAPRAVTVQFS
jgi:hypothetical protein